MIEKRNKQSAVELWRMLRLTRENFYVAMCVQCSRMRRSNGDSLESNRAISLQTFFTLHIHILTRNTHSHNVHSKGDEASYTKHTFSLCIFIFAHNTLTVNAVHSVCTNDYDQCHFADNADMY